MNEPTTVRVEQPVYGAQQLVARAPYEFRFKLADIPGAKWSSPKKAWTYPVSAVTAVALSEVLGIEAFEEGSKEWMLAKSGASIATRKATQFAQDAELGLLKPIPIKSPTDPWKHQLGAFWFCVNVLGIEINDAEK